MRNKNVIFSILEKREKFKLINDIVKIKNLYEKKTKDIQQLKILNNYQSEYIKTIQMKKILGIHINQWKNYNNFISVLQKIIIDNKRMINRNQKIIEENLKKWFIRHNKIKYWKNLNIKNSKKILQIKKIKQQICSDNYAQLESIKKRRLF